MRGIMAGMQLSRNRKNIELYDIAVQIANRRLPR
jgi:hypothetical protein